MADFKADCAGAWSPTGLARAAVDRHRRLLGAAFEQHRVKLEPWHEVLGCQGV